ncbi:MAG TPA: endonuclease/exonuclease/phosphatase family protein [Candidatus Binatia bacterium]|nr:endonuclease/exonuclease/phosphatase family protein [Candidatus Binatia bacterium]
MNLTIATYNLQGAVCERLPAYCAVLHALDADVIALTEADNRAVVEVLAQELRMACVWAEGSGDRHIATLSRFPVESWQIYNRPPLTQAALETRLRLSQGPLTVYGLHLLPYLLLPFEIRRRQAVGRLLQIIRAAQPGPPLIAGDLNAIAPGDRVLQRQNPPRMRRVMALQLFIIFRLAIRRLLRAGYVDCFRHLHPREDGFTWMPGNRTTRYDYIMAPPWMAPALRACHVVDDLPMLETASDHFPLVAQFQLPLNLWASP